jgi:hypothetical protein
MGGDVFRYNLVTKFVCANCGQQLRLSYEAPKTTKYNQFADSGITGACKVEQDVSIYPCDSCYGEAIRPIKALADAMKAAESHAGKEG